MFNGKSDCEVCYSSLDDSQNEAVVSNSKSSSSDPSQHPLSVRKPMAKHHHHKATPDRLQSITPATGTSSSSTSPQIKKSFHVAATVTKNTLRESAEPNLRFNRVKHQALEVEGYVPVLVSGTH